MGCSFLPMSAGHDDALAIILAAFTPSLDLLGLSTVASNQTLEKVTENAQRILALIHREDIGTLALPFFLEQCSASRSACRS